MRFIRGDSLKEAIDRFHGTNAGRPARARETWPCAGCSAGSSTSAGRSATPTAAGCCTATSSRATSCSASTARRWSSTGAWPSPSTAGTTPSRRPDSTPPSAAARLDVARARRGDAGYMSPEQARGRPDLLGPASDVYSLGRPSTPPDRPGPRHEAGRSARAPTATTSSRASRPAQVEPTVPRALEAVCLKAMADRARGPLRRPRPWPTTSSAGWPTSRSSA